jgi:AcrR family transcriptional regulator
MTLKEDVRGQILKAALDLMNEDGLGALSMREVARRAGVSHQAPYHYFADREAILAELAREGFETLNRYIAGALEGQDGAARGMAAMGEAYVNFALDHPALFSLMFRCELVDLSKYPEAKAVAEEAFNAPIRVIAQTYGEDDPTVPTRMLACWSMAHGLATLLLEGKLAKHFGESREAWHAGAKAVIDLYAASLNPGK